MKVRFIKRVIIPVVAVMAITTAILANFANADPILVSLNTYQSASR